MPLCGTGTRRSGSPRTPKALTMTTPDPDAHDHRPVVEETDELLIDGQEEVFSRTEVELGRIEHHVEAGGAATPSSDRD